MAAVAAESCAVRACQLVAHSPNARALYDLQREETRKIYCEIERKRCPRCAKIVAGQVLNAMPQAKLSNELVAEVAERHYVLGRTLGQISERLGINYATLADSLQRVGKMLAPCLEKLKLDYRAAAARRADGGNGYSWYFGSAEVSLYLFRATRSASVALEVLGKEPLGGVLVVDRYAGYNRAPSPIQYCYAHLLREMKDLAAEFETSEEVQNYARAMKICLTDAMQLRNRQLSESAYGEAAAVIKGQMRALSQRSAGHPGVRKWQDFYVAKAERLYHWCESAAIPAENNYAEREIRKVVIARKLSFGSQSAAGAKTREIWTSILQSLKKREANGRAKLLTALSQLSQNPDLDIASVLFGGPAS